MSDEYLQPRGARRTVALSAALVMAIGACSGGAPSGEDSSAGGTTTGGTANATGGGTAVGGSTVNGGARSVGGSDPAGGTGSMGGSSPSGGAANPGGMGGTVAAGGTLPQGGNAPKGGSTVVTIGGAATQGGVTSTGGKLATGGATAQGGATSTGGKLATGGVAVQGGATSTGGAAVQGGATSTGGKLATGGAAVQGGATSTGGAPSTGGARSTGGVTSTGGANAAGGASNSTCAGETSGVTASKIVYVSPSGTSSKSGASASSPKDLISSLDSVQPGEMLLLAPGTYSITYTSGKKNTVVLSKAGTSAQPIKIVAANCGRAVIDFSFPEQTWVQDSYGFSLTGSYYYFKGLDITRAGYQGIYVFGQHNTFENCTFHDNRNTGLEINEGGAYTTVINCDAYRNYDPKKNGGMADGFGPKQTQGPGNKFIGCRAWENSDDGFDAFDSPQTVTFEQCWAFRNGVDVWKYGSFAGNGNGFKAGGNGALANHKLTQCVAFGNVVKGFDQNNNTGGITLHNCTGYNNATNYGLGGTLASGQSHVLKNNISLGGGTNSFGTSATQQNNSWNSGFSAAAADFVSLDVSQATAARNPDGSLPKTTLFRLASTSKLVDAGVNVGLSYSGSAPDLGAFELGQ